MTLLSMAASYRQGGDLIRLRIISLREAAVTSGGEERRHLEQRIRELQTLYQETRAVAQVLERYYDRRYHADERYTL